MQCQVHAQHLIFVDVTKTITAVGVIGDIDFCFFGFGSMEWILFLSSLMMSTIFKQIVDQISCMYSYNNCYKSAQSERTQFADLATNGLDKVLELWQHLAFKIL